MLTPTPARTLNIPSRTWPAGVSTFGPATVPANITRGFILFIDATWTTDSAGLTGSLAIEFSTDGGTTWNPLASVTFTGGGSAAPGVSTDCTPGTQVRGTLTLSQPITSGGQINLYT